MTTQGSSEDPSSAARGAVSGEEGSSQGSVEGSVEGPAEGSIAGSVPGDGAGGSGVAHAYRGEEVPPPPHTARGRYHFDAPPLNHPPDPVLPFIAPPVPRRRRSDWPVLVAALIIAGVALAACCVAGFALYASRAPFGQ